MRLYLLRHTETVANKEGYIYGKKDYPLTEVGEAQLRRAVAHCEGIEGVTIVTSPLGRAKTLGMALAKRYHWPLEEVAYLEEMGYGVLEGLTAEAATLAYPEVMAGLMSGEGAYEIPEGESGLQFTARVTEGFDALIEAGKDVLVVSHGGVIRTALEHILDLEPDLLWKLDIGNGSLIELHCGQDGAHTLHGLKNL